MAGEDHQLRMVDRRLITLHAPVGEGLEKGLTSRPIMLVHMSRRI
jgi:hypothetical protein